MTLPRLSFASGTVEALKWAAAACMVLDHANRALTGYTLGTWAEVLGRLAFPIFAVVFGYNLARPGVDAARIAQRLAGWGAFASLAYVPLFDRGWPLNVLFTLAAAAWCIHLGANVKGLAAALASGCIVDYFLPGIALVIAAYAYSRNPAAWPLWLAAGALFGVSALVGNLYAFFAVPLLVLAARWHAPVPRSRRAFLHVYVGHLAVLLLLARV